MRNGFLSTILLCMKKKLRGDFLCSDMRLMVVDVIWLTSFWANYENLYDQLIFNFLNFNSNILQEKGSGIL